MAKRKGTKGQSMVDKTTTKKIKDCATHTALNTGD